MLGLATTSIAWVLIAVMTLGWIFYYFLNNSSSRSELGSEVELAPNRKPYYDDEELEGPRLERMQMVGFLLLITMVIGLPLYWVLEPGRQSGAREAEDSRFADWGGQLFATTADGGFNCAGCHGGMSAGGGSAPYALSDPNTGEVAQVTWYAPALNTVFYKFSRDEVKFILEYGRPFSPMSAWGVVGGGPMNDQQIETLLWYLERIQVEPEGCLGDAQGFTRLDFELCDSGTVPADVQEDITAAVADYIKRNPGATEGEALFNLDLASGAYSCARCHTPGWSYGAQGVTAQGAFGWNLTGGSVDAKFPNEADMITFIENGSEYGKKYGTQGQGSGRMPGFGSILTDEQIKAVVEYVRSL
jgi:mono/diheme cytochrome c family protein